MLAAYKGDLQEVKLFVKNGACHLKCYYDEVVQFAFDVGQQAIYEYLKNLSDEERYDKRYSCIVDDCFSALTTFC